MARRIGKLSFLAGGRVEHTEAIYRFAAPIMDADETESAAAGSEQAAKAERESASDFG